MRNMAIVLSLLCFAWFGTSVAFHDKPSAEQLGVNNEIGAYLHQATNGGPLHAVIILICHKQPNCPPSDQTAFVLFYRTAEAREQGVGIDHPDYLGAGQFHVKQDGESLGKIIDFVYPDGTRWNGPSGVLM